MEEIIASELEEEVKFTLPKLCWLELYDLQEVKNLDSFSYMFLCFLLHIFLLFGASIKILFPLIIVSKKKSLV